MKLLFVDACPRREESRTLQLARTFLQGVGESCPGVEVITHCLPEMGLLPVDQLWLREKEAACDRKDFQGEMFAPVHDLQKVQAVVAAAPYWDLSFPAMLKIWMEHMYVRNLTFRYEYDRPLGLCPCRESVYITTAGSPIADQGFGAGYFHAALRVLGIRESETITAESLDLSSSDPAAILEAAHQKARAAGAALGLRLLKGAV